MLSVCSKQGERLKQLKNIKLIETEHFDRSKIVLSVKNLKNTDGEVLNGKRFQEMLRSYHLEMEMASRVLCDCYDRTGRYTRRNGQIGSGSDGD